MNVQQSATAKSIIQGIRTLNDKIASVNENRKTHHADMRDLTAKIIDAIGKIRSDNAGLESTAQSQAKQIETLEGELADLRTSGTENIQNGEDLKNLINKLGKEIGEKDKELIELKAELVKTNEENESLRDNITALSENIQILRAQLDELNEKLETNATALKSIESQYANSIDNISDEYELLNQSIVKLLDHVDGDEQRANLEQILGAITGQAGARAQLVVPSQIPYPSNLHNLMRELNSIIESYFKFNEQTKEYDVSNQLLFQVNKITPIIVSRQIYDDVMQNNTELSKKIIAYDKVFNTKILKFDPPKIVSSMSSSATAPPTPTTTTATATASDNNKPKGYDEFVNKFNEAYNKFFDESSGKLKTGLFDSIQKEPDMPATQSIYDYVKNTNPELNEKMQEYRKFGKLGKLGKKGGATRKKQRKHKNKSKRRKQHKSKNKSKRRKQRKSRSRRSK